MKNLKRNKKGFTLIEMIVVIVIIAILIALAVPAVMGYVQDARESKLLTSAHAGTVTMQAELAKSEARGELDSAKLTSIKTTGKDAADADSVEICKQSYSDQTVKAAACPADKVFTITDGPAATKDSVEDIADFRFTIDGKVYIVPATGNAEAEVVAPDAN